MESEGTVGKLRKFKILPLISRVILKFIINSRKPRIVYSMNIYLL